MKFYILNDIHMLSRNYTKFDDICLNRIKNFLNGIEEHSLVFIAGDLFDSPLPRTNTGFSNLIELLNVIRNSGHYFVITEGNHDFTYHGSNKVSLFDIINSHELTEDIEVSDYKELPNVCTVNRNVVNITIGDYNFVCIPFSCNSENKRYAKPGKKNIAICHGITQKEFENGVDYKESEVINSKLISNCETVFKGHIHQRYNSGNVYSVGCITKFRTHYNTGYGVYEDGNISMCEFNDKLNLYFKRFDCTEEDINETLSKIMPFDIVTIIYDGDPKRIDPEILEKAKNCFMFKIIFKINTKTENFNDESYTDFVEKNIDENIVEDFKTLLAEI